ncbi:type II toxin-antitoxin system Phd/YefM family antitoxin [Patescibacteria group bacterium]|nr:type II toxin-antitoxin system Phd/YefM family antitoxin [Patescibacteria group bacterium]MBU1885061.1 type II toxin-antitoxin system Phd/YefM family antitoxin [Patescibacteria group bacterium]
MQVITTTTLRKYLSDSVDKVSGDKDYLLIARRGKIVSALVNIDLFEDLVALMNKDYKESIAQARDEYEQGEYVSHEQLFGEL